MVRINGWFHLLINGVYWGYNPLLGQWLNFKLFGITYLVGKISRSNFFFQGPLAEWDPLIRSPLIRSPTQRDIQVAQRFFVVKNVCLQGWNYCCNLCAVDLGEQTWTFWLWCPTTLKARGCFFCGEDKKRWKKNGSSKLTQPMSKWLKLFGDYIWPIYNDLSRGHPKWWFSKGILPKMALN